MQREEVRYEEFAKELLQQLPRGAFLSLKGTPDNTMTIGWGGVGYMWKKPVLMVMVRYSRHSYKLIEEAGEFSVSVPLDQDMKSELLQCGRNSGRDMDKFESFNLKKDPGMALLDTPVVGNCALQFECRTMLRQEMDPSSLDEVIRETAYADNDFHVLYFGEILASYIQK
jgi:flavin reductase (DIM6/NTAB) family NADH-FMN oxidoreductase RutF